jgi:23S rRNA pseudouridine1911/1915/1917 synthase
VAAERFTVDAGAGGLRADKFLASKLAGRGRRALAEAFDEGRVRVNGKKAKKGQLVGVGDVVELEGVVEPTGGEAPIAEPEQPLRVVHEDARLVVVDKPAGMPTHPLRVGERGTLAGAVAARFPECAAAGEMPREGGAAHRLDAGTSGLVVFARDREAWRALRDAFGEGRVDKTYLALVAGRVASPGECDLPLKHGRGDAAGKSLIALEGAPGALDALTTWNPVAVGERTLLRVVAATGRMHQVRAHLAHMGWPIVGDTLYGGPALPGYDGHCLHATRLVLPHPNGGKLTVESPAPPWPPEASGESQARRA